MTSFTVLGIQGKGRPRFASRGGYVTAYTPEKTRVYETTVLAAYKAAGAG